MGFDSNEEALVSGYGDQRRRAEEGSQRRKQATRMSKRNQDCQKCRRELKQGNGAYKQNLNEHTF
jgi:hypothetical protein